MMRRFVWILAMAPVMWSLLQLVISADRLHAWQYSEQFDPPTAADCTRAAIAFWGAVLTPVFIGMLMAVVAFRRKYQPHWCVFEMGIIAFLFLVIATGELGGIFFRSNAAANLFWHLISWACLPVGGVVVLSLLNLGACVRKRVWGKFALTIVVFCSAMLYLLWLNAFIIYIDT